MNHVKGHAERLSALRARLAAMGIQGFLAPRADEHLGEYVPPHAERLAWLTGFDGSAGLAVVLPERAALFVDGRYTAQAASQIDAALWERRHLIEQPPPRWLAEAAPGARIGYDPWLHAEESLARYREAGVALAPLDANPIDAIWADRPLAPSAPAFAHPLALTGRSSADKRADLAAILRGAGQAAAVLTDPASVCWLLNIRGGDVAHAPFALGFAILRDDARASLFMAPEKLSPELRDWLGPEVTAHPPSALPGALAALAGHAVRVDAAGAPSWFADTLRAAGATVIGAPDPCLLPKACKNMAERAGARAAQARDAVALCRFLCWLDRHPARGRETEASAARRLLALRAEAPGFRGESFPAISAAGPHAALPHYRVGPDSDRAIGANGLYLIDSGAQYEDGTTDVTRTVWTGPDAPPRALCEHYTRVLAGHIDLARLRFPRGCAGPHLDGFARRALWEAGLDFDHGTGHGVGSYLSVHEGPASFSRAAKPVALAPGMILSNEPGFYLPGAYGIRLENLLLVREASERFLEFETLTLAPFDRRLVLPELLHAAQLAWLGAYHARVLEALGPELGEKERGWLEEACAPIDRNKIDPGA